MVDGLRRAQESHSKFSLESIGDFPSQMENKRKLRSLRVTMLVTDLVGEALEVGTVVIGILTNVWLPFFAIGLPAVIALAILVSIVYFKRLEYICPKFKPKFKEVF